MPGADRSIIKEANIGSARTSVHIQSMFSIITVYVFLCVYISIIIIAGTSVEASVGRGELFPLSCPKAVGCHSERQFSFSNGDNGWGWGGVLCIVFYVCLLVLYLLYIIFFFFFF